MLYEVSQDTEYSFDGVSVSELKKGDKLELNLSVAESMDYRVKPFKEKATRKTTSTAVKKDIS